MGEMGATSLVADGFSNLTVAAGNKFFILWEMQMLAMEGFPDYDMVTMAWQANYTGEVHGQMGYIPSSVGKRSEQKCSFSGSTEGGAVTHFQCQFDCHP